MTTLVAPPVRRSSRWAAAAALLLVAACDDRPPPPQEQWTVVKSVAAPLLRQPKPTSEPQDIARAGELIKVVREIKPLVWTAKMEGVEAKRDSVLLEVKYSDDAVVRFGFQSDLGEQVNVPVASWLCEAVEDPGQVDRALCPGLLRRARLHDGALLVYAAHVAGHSPIAVVRGRDVVTVTIDDMTDARFYMGKKRSLLVVATRWTKDSGKQSGGAYVPVVIEDKGPVLKEPIASDLVDARNPDRVVARLARSTVTATEIAITGEEVVKAPDGTTVSTKPIDEKHPLPSLD